jgi:hypothetical protein
MPVGGIRMTRRERDVLRLPADLSRSPHPGKTTGFGRPHSIAKIR